MFTTSILIPFFQGMPPKAVHEIAQGDTPQDVNVPNSWAGIFTWVGGKWGGSAIVSVVLTYGMMTIYSDMKAQNEKTSERMIQVFEKQAESAANYNSSMMQLKMAIDALTQEARIAHRGA